MKKLLTTSLFAILILSACGRPQYMDKPADDGNYYYQNEDLAFEIVLPPEFVYYQTQRLETNNWIDIEFFIPTSDPEYTALVPNSYAKPIVVRVFEKDYWNSESAMSDRELYKEMVDKNGRIYTLRFWDSLPTDWTDKWSNEMALSIMDSFDVKNN